MNTYTDGFVLCVPQDKLNDYIKLATSAGKIWREHGAIEYRECVGDDMEAKDMIAFPEMAKAGPDEVVVFAWAVFESREHRDETNRKIMADPRMAEMCGAVGTLFDCKKMAYGGFRTIVQF